MAQFAPVAPIQILEALAEADHLGHYHLLLAHHVLEEADRFRALFDNWFEKTKRPSTIIMDNSVVEMGDAMNTAKVLEACQVLQPKAHSPNWVIPVLTDVMANGAQTRVSATDDYTWWQEHAPDWPLMVLLQAGGWHIDDGDEGAHYEELWSDFCKSADHFLLGDFPKIEYVGIPRLLVNLLDGRNRAIKYVDAIRPDINVHLFGFSDDVTDDVICAQHPSVEGIDSAVPIRYGYSGGEGLFTPSCVIPPRPKDWFEKGEYDEQIWHNLEAMRRWVA